MITGNKHNIINVDALHKYHTGVNTPSISEELINENVTSFRVGTSNVNDVDLTNQMEQSLVDITYIKGNTVKENNVYNPTVIPFSSGNKKLYSLKNGLCDEYLNGKLHKRIRSLTVEDFDLTKVFCGSNAGWNVSGETYAFYVNNIGGDCIEEITIECNFLDHMFDIGNQDIAGLTVSSEWKWIGFRIKNKFLGITSSDSNTVKLEKAKNWLKTSSFEILYRINEVITDESITVLANPNEEINIVSGTPTTIKHTVQLNTKSQVEETQKQIAKSNKNIWQKFKELTDVEINLNNTGYIKLPTALGGLILQWGIISPTLSNYGSDTYIEFPVHFSNKVFNIQTSCSGKAPGFAQEVFVSAYNTNNYGTRILVKDKQHESPTIYVSWLAIGK